MHPFALMMHTHRHGKVVSTWRVRRNIAGRDQWSLLDKRDPLIAQHYYPIQDPSMTLVYGDQLAFRCTMVNLGEKVLFSWKWFHGKIFMCMWGVIVTIYCALCSRLPQSRNFHEICSYDAGKKKILMVIQIYCNAVEYVTSLLMLVLCNTYWYFVVLVRNINKEDRHYIKLVKY